MRSNACDSLRQLVVASQPDPGLELAGAQALGAAGERRDRPRDRAQQVTADRDRQDDRQREAGDDHDPGPGPDALGARAGRVAGALQGPVQLAVDRHHPLDRRLGPRVQLAHPVAGPGVDGRQHLGAEPAITLGDQHLDLVGLGDRPGPGHHRAQVPGGGARLGRDLLVVGDVGVVPLEEAVGLVDVLLARHRRRVVPGVLGVVEPCHLALGAADLGQRHQHHRQRQPEQQQHRGERDHDPRGGGARTARAGGHGWPATMQPVGRR
jgi:hypothetical protein